MTYLHRLGAPTAAILTLAAVSLLFTACSSDDDPSTTASSADASERIRDFGTELTGKRAGQAEAVVRDYLAARAAGKWSKACSYLAKPNRRLLAKAGAASDRVDGVGCAATVEVATGMLSPSERDALVAADVGPVRADGDRGYVLYDDSVGDELAMRVREEGSRWKVASVSATSIGGAS